MTTPTNARQRARVRRLASQELSNRAIAGRVGVSESTVRRWRADDASMTQQAAIGDAPTDAPATQGDAPTDAPVAHPAAPLAASPAALTLQVDADMAHHLAVLAEAGHDAQAAVCRALEFLADGYAYAWDYGITRRGTAPVMRVQVKGDRAPRLPW